MKVGFTGTRKGMTDYQKKMLENIIGSNSIEILYHGDCVGADADAHDIAKKNGIKTEIFPPINSTLRAFKESEVIHEPAPYLVRNRYIVNSSDLLIACPDTREEKKHSGTWATIKFADRIKKPVLIIFPEEFLK